MYEHQQWAMKLLGIDAFNEHHQRAVMRAFRPPVLNASEVRAMAVDIMSWLFTRGIRMPGPRRVQAIALKVVRRAEHEMASSVRSAIPDYVLLLREQEFVHRMGLHVKKLHALDEDRLLDRATNRFLNEIGTVQFSQIIVDIDKEIRFSGLLLQRAPRDTQELLSVYGVLLAHRTARSVNEAGEGRQTI